MPDSKTRRLSLLFAAFAALAVTAPSRVGAATVLSPDAALTQRVLATDPSAPAPAVQMNDFRALRDAAPQSRGDVYGTLAWFAPSGEAPARGVKLFLLPSDDYTAWFAALATASALGDKNAVATLDYDVRAYALDTTVVDRYGRFRFGLKAPGTYILFAVLHETVGLAVPAESTQRGFDGAGRSADVVVPSIDIPRSHTASFRYLYVYTLPPDRRGWDLGVVRPNAMLHDGKPVVLR